MNRHALTRDNALLALHDRFGRDVEVTVEVEKMGDSTFAPMRARGTLRHHGGGWPHDDIVGLYDVGEASFDVTEMDGARLLADDDEPPYGVSFELADGVRLIVVWGAQKRPDRS